MSVNFDAEDDTDFSPVYTLNDDSKPYATKSHVGPLYPMPSKRHRAILRWILLGLHVGIFAGVVFGYNTLTGLFTDADTQNLVKIGIPAWGLVVIVHLLVVIVLDIRENFIYMRRERQRRADMEKQIKRNRMMQQLYARPAGNAEELHPLS